MSDAPRPRQVAPRNLTSLVDTVFLLVFSLLALSETRRTEATELVRVELPAVERDDQARPSPAGRMVLQVTDRSQVFVGSDRAPVATRAELDRALDAARGRHLPEELTVDIEADRDARHGVTVELLQHLRLAGYVHVRLLARGEPDLAGPFGGER